MPFRTRRTGQPTAESPEALFRQLRRPRNGPPHLWSHQADVLRDYVRQHLGTPDVALELPTGAGKTLVGLLIGEWRRRTEGANIVYCSPTRQLAQQVGTHARTYGIEVNVLVGRSSEWRDAPLLEYRNADKIAVTTYSHIFNTHPRFDDADVLILDDAHSGADFVANAWTVAIERDSVPYGLLLGMLDGVDPLLLNRLRRDDPDPSWRWDVDLVPPRLVHRYAPQIDSILSAHLEGNARYAHRMLNGQLAACFLFLSWDRMELRPLHPPTSFHAPFQGPNQRLYVSATLGQGGELERAFGRPSIQRLPVPVGWDEQGTGRRFFIFPDLTGAQQSDVTTFVHSTVREFDGRVVLIAPDSRSLDSAASTWLPVDLPIVTAKEFEKDPDRFLAPGSRALCLANRYDGIDLPDRSCRLIILAGLPLAVGIYERFLVQSVGASSVLTERTRTRIVQGAGRCTRNPNDYAAVIMLGSDLVQFCGRRDVQRSTHKELQAEMDFGIHNSMTELADLPALLTHFRDQDDDWREVAEPDILNRRGTSEVEAFPGATELHAAAADEVEACDAAWRGEWIRAVEKARNALASLSGGAELRPYQALWNYLASSWAAIAAVSGSGSHYRSVSADFMTRAHAAARSAMWLQWSMDEDRQVEGDEATASHALAAPAISVAFSRFEHWTRGDKLEHAEGSIQSLLASGSASAYEAALKELGELLGADPSYKPSGQGRPDCVWVFGGELWVIWEAKSEESPSGEVSLTTVRQANTHRQSVAIDRATSIPPQSPIIIVTPRTSVSQPARQLAEGALYLLQPDDVVALVRDAVEAWRELRPMQGLSESVRRRQLADRLHVHAICGQPLLERLTAKRIRGGIP